MQIRLTRDRYPVACTYLARVVALPLACLALLACESGVGTSGTGTGNGAGQAAGIPPSEFDAGEVRSVQEYLAEPRYQEADLRRGEVLALACRACHTMGTGQDHQLGPNLHGIFGREAASLPGFEYSAALRESGLIWTPAALEAWLQHPADFIPGNAMVFAGLRAEVDRRDLLAYLLRATAQ